MRLAWAEGFPAGIDAADGHKYLISMQLRVANCFIIHVDVAGPNAACGHFGIFQTWFSEFKDAGNRQQNTGTRGPGS